MFPFASNRYGVGVSSPGPPMTAMSSGMSWRADVSAALVCDRAPDGIAAATKRRTDSHRMECRIPPLLEDWRLHYSKIGDGLAEDRRSADGGGGGKTVVTARPGGVNFPPCDSRSCATRSGTT